MNKSGIFSLAGFAYQIKVFVYMLSLLQENQKIGYETFDDIALQKSDTTKENQENKLHTYNGLLDTNTSITALQIKHTGLSAEDYKKVLFNWIILHNSGTSVDEYVLMVDSSYSNEESVFPVDLKPLFDEIVSSNRSNAALITKVKNIINGDYSLFCSICSDIQEKYKFEEIENIDEKIFDAYKPILIHGGVKDTTYSLRIEELVKKMQYEILSSISNLNSYSCDYLTFKHIVENIVSCVRDDFYLPDFSDFKNSTKLDIKDTDIVKSRQYVQLSKCNLAEPFIKEHLIYEEYYNSYKLRNLENLNANQISNIEETTHGNFELTKVFLQQDGSDTPIKRLKGTLDCDNSYTHNTQIRKGSAIHLTKSETEKSLLISWEDE